MKAASLLQELELRDSSWELLPIELLALANRLNIEEFQIAFSCLHDPKKYVSYQNDAIGEIIDEPIIDECHERDGGVFCSNVQIQATYDQDTAPKSIYLKFRATSDLDVDDIVAIIKAYIEKSFARQRSIIRRKLIDAKLGSNDVGTFCYRLLHENLAGLGVAAQCASIFVLDKYSGELRLRAQLPLREDRRHLADVSVTLQSKSWIAKSFKNSQPYAEFSVEGNLPKGRTVERDSASYFSRVYWPLRMQPHSLRKHKRQARDGSTGVIRFSNAFSDQCGGFRPFHCLDSLALDFLAESLNNIIGFFVDSHVDGFDKDLAFHAAKSPAVGCLKNIRLATQLLFNPEEMPFLDSSEHAIPRQFELQPIDRFGEEPLKRSLNNAYAFALNIAAQVERANITEELDNAQSHIVERLFADVIQKSINLIPYFEVSHSLDSNVGEFKRVEVTKIFDLNLPPPILGDIGAFTSVFNNLFENSIKYGKRNSRVKIDIAWRQDARSVFVSFRDNGIGIPSGDEERIFTTGTRSENAKSHTVRGNGLGLAHCRRIMNAHKGSIKAKWHEDGLEFILRFLKAQ